MPAKPAANLSVDEYLQNCPPETRPVLDQLRRMIQELLPDAQEKISYGMPAYFSKGKLVLYFAAQRKHLGFYPTPVRIAAFEAELKPYVHAKGSVQFPYDKPIPWDLIRRMILYVPPQGD